MLKFFTHLEVLKAELFTEDAIGFEASAVRFRRSFSLKKNALVVLLLVVAGVAELARVGAVVAVLAWVGAWPLSTVDPGVSPLFTALQTYPASGLTRH